MWVQVWVTLRLVNVLDPKFRIGYGSRLTKEGKGKSGGGWSRTNVDVSRRIYSLE